MSDVDIITQIVKLEAGNRSLEYEKARITGKCWTLTALHTGAVAQFRSEALLDRFVDELQAFLIRQAADQVIRALEAATASRTEAQAKADAQHAALQAKLDHLDEAIGETSRRLVLAYSGPVSGLQITTE